MKPVLLVIAGPNGAGKTTVTERLRVDHWSEGVEYLNPDDVARDRFGDWNSPSAVLEAARWTTRGARICWRKGVASPSRPCSPRPTSSSSFAGGARRLLRSRLLRRHLESPNQCGPHRASGNRGGHAVPLDRVIAGYCKSLAHLASVIPIAQCVYVFDNSIDDRPATLRARTVEGGGLRELYPPVPSWLESLLMGVPLHPATAT